MDPANMPPKAVWPFRLPEDLPSAEIARLRAEAEELGRRAQYGWGHTIDFGPFQMQGLLGDEYLKIPGALDAWGWWPRSMSGLEVADVGCFTGGHTLMLAARGAQRVFAVDEVPEHLAQCAFLARTFEASSVTCIEAGLYDLRGQIEPGSLDLILCCGVLYHLSDMLVGLMVLRELLKPSGVLILESNAVECFEHSYANFGRFFAGMWWQPTALCIQDLCEHSGFSRPEVRFYTPGRCLVRAVKEPGSRILFKRGVNLRFESLRDEVPRSLDAGQMRPAPCDHE